MRKYSYDADLFEDDKLPVSLINTWHDLAIQIGIQTRYIAYAKRERDNLQHKISIGDGKKKRFVYKSNSPLSGIQKRIEALLTGIATKELDSSKVLAYMSGVNASRVIAQNVNKKYLVTFDIKKYYDHISYRHIKETLMEYGFTKLGAQLVTHLCTVKRTIPGKDQELNTLQQGSAASPVISNLVGYKYIDKPLAAWIADTKARFPYAEFIYARYSDNIFLWVDYPEGKTIPIEVFKEYKEFVKDTLAKSRFWTHHWATIPNNHPKRNQRALGVVLNKKARVDKTLLANWCSTLFNAGRCGLDIAAKNYWDYRGRPFNVDDDDMPTDLREEKDIERFLMVSRGVISYIGSINTEHGLQLKKLFRAAVALYTWQRDGESNADWYQTVELEKPIDWVTDSDYVLDSEVHLVMQHRSRTLFPEALEALKKYKDKRESESDFMERLKLLTNVEKEFPPFEEILVN